ncbi:MAG: hypothetical protein A3E87_05900 [Gammaproteobacteria bacterium RIFCSPHIGHO2_12_FULL_35_23]|nr:MAG: hypothetical protein A3E87_05900 [Gammaproteobacteria bacterium RIFCSPHIGHO2_12_FULL_35_23]
MSDSMRWFMLIMIAIFLAIVYFLGPVLVPFVISFLLAYFLNPLVLYLNRWKIPRVVSAFLVFIIALLIILAALFLLIPALQKQLVAFAHSLPAMINWLKQVLLPWLNQRFHLDLNINADIIQTAVIQHLQANNGDVAKQIFKTIFNSGYMIIDIIIMVIMIPVITLYLLIDWVKVTSDGKRLLPFSAKKRDLAANLIKECGDVLAAFLRGQLLVMIGSGVVYSVGLSILGLNLALLIGVIAGTLTIVPYLGFITGLLAAIIAVTLQFHSWLSILGVLIVFIIGVLCENFVFSPLFIGDRIGLHPVAVIFAVLAGGKLFGFLGVLLALPVAAVVMTMFRHVHNYYFGSGKKGEKA